MPNNSASAGQKPLFEFESFDKNMYDCLFTEYNDNESLFRFYLPFLHEFLDECDIIVSTEVAQIWYHAKKFIQTLCTLNYPENYIERIESVLITGSNNIDFSNAVLLCMYEMMQTSGANVNHHFDKAIEKLDCRPWKSNVAKKEVQRLREENPDDKSRWSSEGDIRSHFKTFFHRNVPCAIEEGEMTDDYDYSKPDPFFTKSENADCGVKTSSNNESNAIISADEHIVVEQKKVHEEELRQLTEKITSLEDTNGKLLDQNGLLETQINELKEQLGEKQAFPVEDGIPDIEYAQKVRMETVCRFFELLKCTYKGPKKQTKAAELMSLITDISHSTCNTYLSKRRNGEPVNEEYHQKEFKRIDELFEELKISTE